MSQLNVGKVVAGVGVELPTLAESNRPTASSGLMFFNSDKNRVEIHSGADWYVLNTLSSQTFGTVQSFAYTGSDQQFTVPNDQGNITELRVFMWGAGGGPDESATAAAGAGGYCRGTIKRSDSGTMNGTTFTVVVGSGGVRGTGSSDMPAVYGGGGRGSRDSGGGHVSGTGGGLSGIFEGSNQIYGSSANPVSDCHTRIIICAGGGGGANDQSSGYAYGGAGGGLEGGRGGSQPSNNNKGGRGGRQQSGYSGSTSGNRVDGDKCRGGDGNTGQDNPGGGGGYYGGQSGSDDNSGAGGGSSYYGGNANYSVSDASTEIGGYGSGQSYSTGGSASQYWSADVGNSSRSNRGGDGKVVIVY